MPEISAKEFQKIRCRRRPRFTRSAKEERTVDGITFDSKAEAIRYRELKALQEERIIDFFLRQPLFDLAGVKYRADFLVVAWAPAGARMIRVEEVKGKYRGRFRQEALRSWRRNAAQVRQLYGIDVELVER